MSTAITTKSLFSQENVQSKFKELLGKRAPQFITSVLQIAASNDLLQKADPFSIYNSAAVAATLDLPLNNNLGYAYIVPYNNKQKDGTFKVVAQFQLGYKGFKQLAQRSGQFLLMHESDVREGEIENYNRLTGEIKFNWIQNESERLKKIVIGYVSYFKLSNGFEHTFYMPIDVVRAHSMKYSQTAKKGYGLWNDNFDDMALKTVCKLNLSKNAPLSVELKTAMVTDQAIINNDEGTEVTYIDNEVVQVDKEAERIVEFINNTEDLDTLLDAKDKIKPEQKDLFNQKIDILTSK